jgi:hypothetical protein
VERRHPEKWVKRYFTAEENIFWLDSVGKRDAVRFVKTANMLHYLGFVVRAYRNQDTKVSCEVAVPYDDKLLTLVTFNPSDPKKARRNPLFGERLDKYKLAENALPIAELVSAMTAANMAATRGGTLLSDEEIKQYAPLLLLFKADEAMTLFKNGISFMTAYTMYVAGVPFKEMLEAQSVPFTYLKQMYAENSKTGTSVQKIDYFN